MPLGFLIYQTIYSTFCYNKTSKHLITSKNAVFFYVLVRSRDWKLNLQKGVRATLLSFAGLSPGARKVVAPSLAPRSNMEKWLSK